MNLSLILPKRMLIRTIASVISQTFIASQYKCLPTLFCFYIFDILTLVIVPKHLSGRRLTYVLVLVPCPLWLWVRDLYICYFVQHVNTLMEILYFSGQDTKMFDWIDIKFALSNITNIFSIFEGQFCSGFEKFLDLCSEHSLKCYKNV